MADVSLLGLEVNITIAQGDTNPIQFRIYGTDGVTPLNMTDYIARLQVRKSHDSGSAVINATLANSKLVWTNQLLGQFMLRLQPSDTTSILFSKDSPDTWEGVWDLEIEHLTDTTIGVQKPFWGAFVIKREVTR